MKLELYKTHPQQIGIILREQNIPSSTQSYSQNMFEENERKKLHT